MREGDAYGYNRAMANFPNIPQLNEQDGIPWRACDKINRAVHTCITLLNDKVVYEKSPTYTSMRAELDAAQAQIKNLEARVAALEARL